MNKIAVEQELKKIEESAGGLLIPESVVTFARNENSALHACFEWDDSKAAHEHRLEQARQLIRLQVVRLPNSDKEVRAYVSLPSDRFEGRGYRHVTAIINTPREAEMIEMARKEMVAFQQRFAELRELADVFKAMQAVG